MAALAVVEDFDEVEDPGFCPSVAGGPAEVDRLEFEGAPEAFHGGVVVAVALVSGADDATLKLWEVDSGRELGSVYLGWTPLAIAWSPRQLYLFAVANSNGTVTLFDLRHFPRG